MATKKKEPLILYAAKESDGYTYALPPESEERLQRKGQPKEDFGRLFLAQDTSQDFAQAHRKLAHLLIPLLTHRSLEEIEELFPVELRDYDEQVLFRWPAAESSEKTPAGKAKTTAPTPKRPRP